MAPLVAKIAWFFAKMQFVTVGEELSLYIAEPKYAVLPLNMHLVTTGEEELREPIAAPLQLSDLLSLKVQVFFCFYPEISWMW